MVQTAQLSPLDDSTTVSDQGSSAPGSFASFEKKTHRHTFAHQEMRHAIAIMLYSIVALYPLFFGGVHPTTFLVTQTIISLGTLVVLIRERTLVLRVMGERPLLATLLVGLAAFVAYAAATPLVVSFFEPTYPVVGRIATHYAPDALNNYRAFLTAAALIFLTNLYTFQSPHRRHQVIFAVASAAIGIALIALSHWFYDNGLLFWTFQPDNVFTSPRARWPFVNANHLGGYLLPGLFLMVLLLRESLARLDEALQGTVSRRSRTLKDLLISRSQQKKVTALPLYGLLLGTIFVAILGTLSRGVWTGIVAGAVTGFFMQRLVGTRPSVRDHRAAAQAETGASTQASPSAAQRTRRRRTKRGSDESRSDFFAPLVTILRNSRLIRTVAFCAIALGAVAVLLGERGSELFVDRVQYGLLHSREDMRWEMLADTIPMIKDHLLFGVGLGNWNEIYSRYATPLLAGMNAGYLHNDILQVLAETGIIGFLMLATLVGLVAKGTLSLRGLSAPDARLVATTSSILVAILVACLFDFQLHIPAIVGSTCVVLGLHIGLIEELKRNRS